MNLTEYVRILIRRGWIIVLLAAIAGGSAYLFSRQDSPVYRSTQRVLIEPSRTDFGLAEASARLLEPLVVLLDSQEIAAQIINTLNLDMTPGELKGNVTIAADQFRMTIQIDVDNEDGDVANDIAREWGQVLVDYRNERNATVRREDKVNAVPVDTPRYYQVSPKPKLNAIAGALLGVIVSGVIIFVMEFLESSIIRRGEDVERITDLPILASIPDIDGR